MLDFNKSERIHPCHMDKDELQKLVDLVKTDFDPSERREDFTVSTNQDGINVSEHTLKDFLAHDRLPQTLRRVTINIIGWSEEREINKRVELRFFDNFIDLDVSGSSETWVNGKFEQLTTFLRKTRPHLWFLHSHITYAFIGANTVVVLGGLVYIGRQLYNSEPIGISLPAAIFFLSVLGISISYHKYTQIFLEERQTLTEKYKDIFTIVMALGSIAAIIGLFL